MSKLPKGAVAAGHELTAEAMAEIIDEGGNAFDAVLAGVFMACVAEPVLASPGGGGFCMALEGDSGRVRLFDFFSQTPHIKRPPEEIDFYPIIANFGTATQEFHIGAGSAATPGFAQGVAGVHEALGKLPLPRIAAPAIEAARRGVKVTAFQAYLHTIISPILLSNPCAREIFAPDNLLLETGDVIRNPGLGHTFEALAHEGADLFTHGEVGKAILKQSEEQGGHLRQNDLVSYRMENREPLIRKYKGMELALNPPPSSGGILIAFTLGLVEAMHDDERAFARALDLADNARRDAGHCLDTLSGEAALTASLKSLPGHIRVKRGTTHVSAIDADGNAASLTVSNGEGNGLMLGEHGFMLNNILGEEDLNPDGFHRWPENVRLSSMMAPAILTSHDGIVTALGSGGSNRIRSAMAQVSARLAAGEALESAVNAPRLHVERGHLDFEDLLSGELRDELCEEFPDHRAWHERNMFFGGVHAVSRTGDGGFLAAGDPRRSGAARIV